MMKKLTKFSFLTLAVMVLAISLTACEGQSERLARISEIKPEVSYGYTVIGGNSLTIDFKIYDYEDLAYKLVKKEKATLTRTIKNGLIILCISFTNMIPEER